MEEKRLYADYLILPIGMPGCGKGTLGKNLAEKLSVLHVSTGDLIRALPEDDARRKLAMEGKLIPDAEVSKIAHPHLEYSGTLILDGFPRTVAQYEGMINYLSKKAQRKLRDILFIGIDCPPVVALSRLERRALEEGRADDQKEKFAIRMNEYREKTLPLWEMLSTRGSGNTRFMDLLDGTETTALKNGGYFIKIDGRKSKEDVFEDAYKIFTVINNLTRPVASRLKPARVKKPAADSRSAQDYIEK